jgi:hypothetical protein
LCKVLSPYLQVTDSLQIGVIRLVLGYCFESLQKAVLPGKFEGLYHNHSTHFLAASMLQ